MNQNTSTNARRNNPKQVAVDEHGGNYELLEQLGAGGQGTVYRTNHPGVLVKLGPSDEERQRKWASSVRSVMRLPIEDLRIACPRVMIKSPHPGYVMELMAGLEPLEAQIAQIHEYETPAKGYLETGGIIRRIRLLANLAQTLAELHGRGMTYGDVSPNNVFVSTSMEHAQTWLIDADNISTHANSPVVGTPKYMAPEIVRGEAGTSTLTDVWSFSVLAFQLLTTGHPLIGDFIDEEVEHEEAALKGLWPLSSKADPLDQAEQESSKSASPARFLPWVDHPEDRRNELTAALPRNIFCSRAIRALFEQTFNAGLRDPGKRPSMQAWYETLLAATGHCVQCTSCGASYFHRSDYTCPFCDTRGHKGTSVLLREYWQTPSEDILEALPQDIPVPADLPSEVVQKTTGRMIVLSAPLGEPEGFRASTVTAVYLRNWPSPLHLQYGSDDSPEDDETSILVTIRLTEGKVEIGRPPQSRKTSGNDGHPVYLQSENGQVTEIIAGQPFMIPATDKARRYFLHLGDMNKSHAAWLFQW